MLRDTKWIDYVLKILSAVNSGSNSIARVAHDIGGSESYIAKVIATLRKGGFITADYELTKPLDQIMLSEILKLSDPNPAEDPVTKYIVQLILSATNISVKQVLEDNAR